MTSPTRPYVVLDKPLGQTPLQAIEAWKEAHPQHAKLAATYAGRLDPMAEGKLLVLLGDECKRKDAYLGLDKEYEVEVLLDLATDTADVLGMPSYAGTESDPDEQTIRRILAGETGSKDIPYPSYSSKTVNGTPLFQHALAGMLGSIQVPTHMETIYRIQELAGVRISKAALGERVMMTLDHAPRSGEPSKELGRDFRQDEIRVAWKAAFDAMPDREFAVLRLRVTCASGTYMRSLAERIGKELDASGMALSIRRTRIGTFRQLLGIGFWTRRFA
jgi:tRNA pseudouridine55 synthase